MIEGGPSCGRITLRRIGTTNDMSTGSAMPTEEEYLELKTRLDEFAHWYRKELAKERTQRGSPKRADRLRDVPARPERNFTLRPEGSSATSGLDLLCDRCGRATDPDMLRHDGLGDVCLSCTL